ncbi:MAG: OmpA family protein, partial [Bacteroidota bacterium]
SYANMLDKIYGGPNASSKPAQMKTGNDGTVTFQVPKGAEMVFSTSKTDYKADRRTVTSDQLAATRPYVIPLEKDKFYAELEVLVVEDPSQNPIPLADIKVLDKTTGKVISLTGDGEAMARTQIDCSHQYEVSASKRPYYDNTVQVKDLVLDCKDGKVRVIVPLKAPLTVILEPIFFDFDRSYIRKGDAVPTLDSLVFIMKQYPTLHVHLGAHCDARGSHPYNDALAERRAESSKKYLVGKGIDAARISTKPFGERDPINNCVDKVFCTEPQHQLNRRVDVDPERHQEAGVDFKKKEIKVGK